MKEKFKKLIHLIMYFLFSDSPYQTIQNLKKLRLFNNKELKFNEIKIFINKKYIMLLNNYEFILVNKPMIHNKQIANIEQIDLINYDLEFYTYNNKNDGLIVYLKTYVNLDKKPIKKINLQIQTDEKELNNEDKDVLEWLLQ